MLQLEDQGTSTLPRERRRAQPASSSVLMTGFVIAVSSASPTPAPRPQDRSPFVAIDVDADLPATISRVAQRQTLLSETYGAENTAENLARESSVRNARRVELLTLRLNRTLSTAETRELDALQISEGARFGARMHAGNDLLRKLLQS